jgi:succinate dehydrogenase / fumarate reductase cytochrome b subunit
MSTASGAASAGSSDHSFLLRKLHSVSGLFPIGAFLLQHIYAQVLALKGPDAYNQHVAFLVSLPFLVTVETVFIFAPLAFHGGYGIYIWSRGESNVTEYPYAGNWLYFWQRVSGMIACVYICYHLYEQRFTGIHLATHPEQAYQKVSASLQNPLILAFYAVGMIAACFHLAYGMWLFGCKWGITMGPRSQRLSAALCGGLGVMACAGGLASLVQFLRFP